MLPGFLEAPITAIERGYRRELSDTTVAIRSLSSSFLTTLLVWAMGKVM